MASLTLRLALPLDVSSNRANHYANPLISTQISLINPYANHTNPYILTCYSRVPIFSSAPTTTTTWSSSRISSSSSSPSNHSSALVCFVARARSSQDDYERLSVESGVSNSEENEKILTSTEPYLADNFSAILNYEDLCKHLEPTIFKEEVHNNMSLTINC